MDAGPLCRLQALPPEIRSAIWSLVVGSSLAHPAYYACRVVAATPYAYTEKKRFPELPAIAATCRQIRPEALARFYSDNAFVFMIPTTTPGHLHGMERWLHTTNVFQHTRSLTLRFELRTEPLYRPYATMVPSEGAFVEVRFRHKPWPRAIKVAIGGALALECTCAIARAVENVEKRQNTLPDQPLDLDQPPDPIGAWVAPYAIGETLTDYWNRGYQFANREPGAPCDRCRKVLAAMDPRSM